MWPSDRGRHRRDLEAVLSSIDDESRVTSVGTSAEVTSILHQLALAGKRRDPNLGGRVMDLARLMASDLARNLIGHSSTVI